MSQNDGIMTWVATSRNVRCDNVVNISHLFDDMLLMSQNDVDYPETWVDPEMLDVIRVATS